jgi:hypothetical protein
MHDIDLIPLMPSFACATKSESPCAKLTKDAAKKPDATHKARVAAETDV